MARHLCTLLAGFVMVVGGLPGRAGAGKLNDFERDATEDRSDRDEDRPTPTPDDYDSEYGYWYDTGGDLAGDFLAPLSSAILVTPTVTSWARAAADMDRCVELDLEPREPGEPLIPFLRFDVAYQDVESDVAALDYRVQIGYGPIGFELNQTRYEEDEPSDHLDLYRLYGLWRLSYGQRIEIDLGLGGIILDGEDRNSGFSWTIPVLVQPVDWLVVELRPMWSQIRGSRIREYELGALFNWKFAAIKAGYRWTHSPNESLDGPFIGLSLRY